MTRKPATELTEEQKAAAKAEREAAKVAKFQELATKRVGKAVDALATLRGLANKNNYSYTPKHVEIMFATIEKEMETLAALFAPEAVAPAVGNLFDALVTETKSGE